MGINGIIEHHYMFNKIIRDWQVENVHFHNFHMHKVKIVGAHFRNVEFSWDLDRDMPMRVEFIDCHFENVKFKGMHMQHCSFRRCHFEGGLREEEHAHLMEGQTDNTIWTFWKMHIHNTHFWGCTFSKTSFGLGKMYNTHFIRCAFKHHNWYDCMFHQWRLQWMQCKDVKHGMMMVDHKTLNSMCWALAYAYEDMKHSIEHENMISHWQGQHDRNHFHPSVKFHHCKMIHTEFRKCHMRMMHFMHTHFMHCHWMEGHMHHCHFDHCHMNDCEMHCDISEYWWMSHTEMNRCNMHWNDTDHNAMMHWFHCHMRDCHMHWDMMHTAEFHYTRMDECEMSGHMSTMKMHHCLLFHHNWNRMMIEDMYYDQLFSFYSLMTYSHMKTWHHWDEIGDMWKNWMAMAHHDTHHHHTIMFHFERPNCDCDKHHQTPHWWITEKKPVWPMSNAWWSDTWWMHVDWECECDCWWHWWANYDTYSHEDNMWMNMWGPPHHEMMHNHNDCHHHITHSTETTHVITHSSVDAKSEIGMRDDHMAWSMRNQWYWKKHEEFMHYMHCMSM